MTEVAQTVAVAPGGGFLVSPVPRGGIFTREGVAEEQLQMAEAAEQFVKGEVLPRVEQIEHKATVEVDGEEMPLVMKLVHDAAELGLASIELPEEHGGLELDLATSMLCSESLYGCASFAVTLGAHSGIGTLPIAYFGNEEQKAKYLPRLATAEITSCYALTEPGNGSDALGGRTTAVLSEDGSHYVLNGEKQFITNAAWADIAVVFAQIGGKYSGLIVDLSAEGVSRGVEEKKMGIHGSSTASLIFQDVKVPAEDLLGELGDAAKIALNILYVGRLKLGFSALGSAKYATDLTVKFITERRQFGRTISEFDMQRGKLAECVAWIHGAESACYRIIGDISGLVEELPEGHTSLDEIDILRQFGVECAMVKIQGTETLSKVLYHAVRMHGGYGFCEEYQVERLARDNVVDTIFEGTNDINRLVLGGGLVESAYMGRIPFGEFLDGVHDRLEQGADALDPAEGYLGDLVAWAEALKRAAAYATERVLLLGKAVRTEQQPMVLLADFVTELYVAESALARTIELGADHAQAGVRAAIARVLLHQAERAISGLGRDAIVAVTPEHERALHLKNFARLLPDTATDTVAAKRRIAQHVITAGQYDLDQN